MLTRPSSTYGPAAGLRRRPSFFAAGIALLLATGCARPAPVDSQAVRRSVRAALAVVQPHDQAAARAIEIALSEAEAAGSAAQAAPFWRRADGSTQAAWLRVAVLASRAVAEVRRQQVTADAVWATTAMEAERAVASARQRMETPGMGRAEARSLSLAQVRLDQAHHLAAAGELDRATAAAREAMDYAAGPEAQWAALHARFHEPRLVRRWRQEAEETIARSRRTGEAAIVVDKLSRSLRLYRGGLLAHTYQAELGTNGLRPKRYSGDQATPEGFYHVTEKKKGRQTKYYKALLLDYPNRPDRERFRSGQRNGTIPAGASVGGLIEIHGEGGNGRDWTDGCIALDNNDMDSLFRSVRVGTPVTIVGALEP